MRFMTLTLERIYMSGFLSISFKYEIDIFPIQSIDMSIHLHTPRFISQATQVEIVANLLVCQISNENKCFYLTKKA